MKGKDIPGIKKNKCKSIQVRKYYGMIGKVNCM